MIDATHTFILDGDEVPFAPGQTVMQAALAAGHYIPHLCYHPEFKPHGSCKVCTVKVERAHGGRVHAAGAGRHAGRKRRPRNSTRSGARWCRCCSSRATTSARRARRAATASCRRSPTTSACSTPHFDHFFPDRPVDASHPDILLDFNRCILCELCVRASGEVDGKDVFALSGRGISKHLIVNSRERAARRHRHRAHRQGASTCARSA